MKKSIKIAVFVLTAFAFISCDRVTKNLAKEHLQFEAPKSYLNNFFRLEYVENTGAALSLGDNLPQPYSFILLSILPLLFMLVMIGYTFYNIKKLDSLKLIALSLVISGGLGNIIDRLLYDRHVTDFMNMGILGIRTGIFNVADMCVTAGAIMLIIAYRKNAEPEQPQVA
ncbi:signal peptidase II [Mucilaginibacter gynuensis]|uniref:Lipoprotein signal peptidase n=1 Tax=Mucilaginibacter gynuensis TaxID=1302236 RepID=A0ABP8HNJ9_9SPHI